jgi:very-short-patch-repair endonuclease
MTKSAAPLNSSLSRVRERAGVRAVARQLRLSSTDAEQRLWRHLRNKQLAGYKFRRQHPIGAFFADYACLEAMLIIEVDGSQHHEPAAVAADQQRTQVLESAGFTVLRFDNRQALLQTEAVLSVIQEWLAAHGPHPSPLPRAGEGANARSSPSFGEGVNSNAPVLVAEAATSRN